MVERVEAGEPVAEVTRQVGVSRQTASKWLARARRGEPMSDRPSRPRGLARAWDSEASRADALEASLDRCNWDRPHSACGGLPPMSRIYGVNNVLALNS